MSDLITTHNGQPIHWNGHLCEGAQMVSWDRDTFILWTRCGKRDVPANKGYIGGNPSDVTCTDCAQFIESAP